VPEFWVAGFWLDDCANIENANNSVAAIINRVYFRIGDLLEVVSGRWDAPITSQFAPQKLPATALRRSAVAQHRPMQMPIQPLLPSGEECSLALNSSSRIYLLVFLFFENIRGKNTAGCRFRFADREIPSKICIFWRRSRKGTGKEQENRLAHTKNCRI
jgi:hypothetical protein